LTLLQRTMPLVSVLGKLLLASPVIPIAVPPLFFFLYLAVPNSNILPWSVSLCLSLTVFLPASILVFTATQKWLSKGVILLLALALCFCLWGAVTRGTALHRTKSSLTTSQRTQLAGKEFFLAANFYNNEAILPDFISETLKLVDLLGTEHIYISVYENGSKDGSKHLLQDFKHTLDNLSVRNTVVTDSAKKPLMDIEVDRIEYLSGLRNKLLTPLETSEALRQSITHIMFYNDVTFTVEDSLELLFTNDMEYDAVCSLDFTWVGDLYDRWVIRDVAGEAFFPHFPFVKDAPSRLSMMAGRPFPVHACWNGIMFARAAPFIKQDLRFRKSRKDEACFNSECFLICNDLRALGYPNILVNPNVLVTYSTERYWSNRFVLLSPIGRCMAAIFNYDAFNESPDILRNGALSTLRKELVEPLSLAIDCVKFT